MALPSHKEVAETYTRAYGEGKPPVQAVAAVYNVAYATAARYVSRARKAGYLPTATPGKAAPAGGVLRGGKLSVRFTAPQPGTYHLGLGAPPHIVGECPPECRGHAHRRVLPPEERCTATFSSMDEIEYDCELRAGHEKYSGHRATLWW